MYSLGFIDEIENVKERTLQIQELYISSGQKMSNMQKNMKKMLEQLEAIEDRKSKEFKDKIQECKDAAKEYEEILNEYEQYGEKLKYVKLSPQVKFNAKKHIYSYTDELGNEVIYDFFDRDENGKLKSKLTDENIKSTINFARSRGLTNRQIKRIDIYVAMILMNSNSNMFDNYIDSIKSGIKPKFGIYYDLRTTDIPQEEMLNKKEFNMIKRSAIAQKKIGIATVLMNKSKFKMVAILTALGIGATSYTAIGDGNNE